jgi:PTS system cellobiose-specific IIB component
MDKLNVLLVCGAGMSSGFLAVNIRKAAARQGIDMAITARSETEIKGYVDEVNCILIGPHFSYLLDDLKEQYKDRDIKIAATEKSYYSTLDGDAALNHIKSLFNK